MKKSLGDSIRLQRRKAQLSQQQVADQMFMERQTISSWERNRTQPDLDKLLQFCDIVGIDLSTLIN